MTVCMEDGLDLVRALRSLPQRECVALLLYAKYGRLDDVARALGYTRQGAGLLVQRALGRARTWYARPTRLERMHEAHVVATQQRAIQLAAAQLAAAARVPPRGMKPMRDAPVFCTYARCSMPTKPVRSGSMHNVCRGNRIKDAQRRWRAGRAA